MLAGTIGLRRRFGALATEEQARIQALPHADLEALAEALLDFQLSPAHRQTLGGIRHDSFLYQGRGGVQRYRQPRRPVQSSPSMRHYSRPNGSRIALEASDLKFISSSLQQIEEQARSLTAGDRAKLAEYMLEPLHTSIEEIDAAWPREIALRLEAFEKGDIFAYSAVQVFEKPVKS